VEKVLKYKLRLADPTEEVFAWGDVDMKGKGEDEDCPER